MKVRLLCLNFVQYKNGNIIIICLFGSQLVQSRLSADFHHCHGVVTVCVDRVPSRMIAPAGMQGGKMGFRLGKGRPPSPAGQCRTRVWAGSSTHFHRFTAREEREREDGSASGSHSVLTWMTKPPETL